MRVSPQQVAKCFKCDQEYTEDQFRKNCAINYDMTCLYADVIDSATMGTAIMEIRSCHECGGMVSMLIGVRED